MSLLLVDVGQTGSRIQLPTGERVTSPVAYTPGDALNLLLERILDDLGTPHASTVLLSLTGLRGQVPDISALAAVCHHATGCDEFGVCDDGLAWSVGSLDGEDGVSIAVGGGVVGVARARQSVFHIDGNGSDFGDSGGAYWLGRKGIRCAIRAIEGSDTPTSLSDAFTQAFGPHDDFVRRCIDTASVHAACIAFSRDVVAASEAGDDVAGGIIDTGAMRLGRVGSALLEKSGLDNGATIALGGGLMENTHYHQAVTDSLIALHPSLTITTPHGNALDGLALLEGEPRRDIDPLMKWWLA